MEGAQKDRSTRQISEICDSGSPGDSASGLCGDGHRGDAALFLPVSLPGGNPGGRHSPAACGPNAPGDCRGAFSMETGGDGSDSRGLHGDSPPLLQISLSPGSVLFGV